MAAAMSAWGKLSAEELSADVADFADLMTELWIAAPERISINPRRLCLSLLSA
jgi:hypothetical protein